MRYGKIGGLAKPISRLVVGADWFSENEEAKAVAVLDAFYEAGGNCIDIAHAYGGGQGQRIVGRWLTARGNRRRIVLLDKCCHPYGGRKRVTAKYLDDDLRENLARLAVKALDIFVLHRDDERVPAGPIIKRLNEHMAAGRIRASGASNWHHSRVAEANEWAARKGLQGFSMSNPNLSLALVNEPRWEGCVTLDVEGRKWHERTQMPLFAWASQGGGFFAGVDTPEMRRVYWNDENFARKERVERMARKKCVSALNVALAWVLCQPFPTFGLIGPRSPEELWSSLGALDVELSRDETLELEGIKAA